MRTMSAIPREMQPTSLSALICALCDATGLPEDDGNVLALAAECHAKYAKDPSLGQRKLLPLLAGVIESGYGEVTGVVYQAKVDRVRVE